MCNVLHDSMHRPRKVDLILIKHGDTYKELRLSSRAPNVLAQFVSFGDKVVGVASNSRISHMCELDFVSSWQEAVENCRDLTLENELSVNQSDFLLRHLCLSSSSSLLLPIGCWAVMFIILVRFLVLIVGESLC